MDLRLRTRFERSRRNTRLRHRTRNEDTARGRLQATGRVEAEPRMDVRDVAKGVVVKSHLDEIEYEAKSLRSFIAGGL